MMQLRVGARVAHDHGVGDVGAELELVLDLAGRDVLAAGGDDDVLHAVGDAEEAVRVHRADVAGAQPAVGGEGLGGLFRQVQVTGEHVRPLHLDLAGLGVEPDLVEVGRRPDRARLDAIDRHAGGGAAGSVMPQTSSIGTPSDRYHRISSGEIGAAPVTR